ncbi:MAG: HEAT repeat domain-containing protein [Cyanobacteria bacterium P01_F01_bin.56]
MADALNPLIDAIEKADSATALSDAVQDLADTGLPETAPYLIEALSYNNPGAAVAAVDGLVKLGSSVVPGLLEQLDVNNYTARAWAIRALAGIGDPRGLLTLLGAATADMSMSVRRAAARGLGQMQWHQFPSHLLEVAQTEALEALVFIAQQDEEWVVRYAAVVGLESLVLNSPSLDSRQRAQIFQQFDLMVTHEQSAAVRARVWQVQQSLQATIPLDKTTPAGERSPLSITDWEQIMARLYTRKVKERSAIPQGDSSYFQELLNAGSISGP